ncbi:Sulfide:quinone oxidoreductase mitochondrial [Fasciolopsis buskii]|uniref:Sulfide:quinone oxidoreductase, mitochondrial n=1 Tax=Fasciolopsis buskii TaxID=27845 RepID=A0A8E0VNM9_9TREM|nr:Sulfide:quinone oxidoreductase mitochondrial [Fasciolopsis buski]
MELHAKVTPVIRIVRAMSRKLYTSTVRQTTDHHHFLIIGSGSGGIAVASRLANGTSPDKVTLVEPEKTHYYQPLWTLIGAGIRQVKDSERPMSKVIPRSVNFISDRVVRFEPDASLVHLSSGRQLSYDFLILALGMRLRFDKIPGAMEALEGDPRVLSNYSLPHLEKTFKAYQTFQGGRAVFTLPCGPIKCAGAPQKVMYLFDDYLRKHNLREKADIHYYTSLPKMFSVDKYAESLRQLCVERKINTHLQYHLVEVDHGLSEAVVEEIPTKKRHTIKYDLLHITPPMSPPEVLETAPKLTNPDMFGYVNVDYQTLRHRVYPNIFALGDCAALPVSKTAAAISSQSLTVYKNLIDLTKGGNGDVSKYDGYTACPLVTSYNRGIIAEFDYTNQPLETLPLDQSKERYIHYFIKAIMMPPLYWDFFVKGLWSGPKYIRKILHLGLSK